MLRSLILLAALALAWWIAAGCGGEPEPRWYRGNTHTHTLWSDGDAAPEVVADWYVSRGYASSGVFLEHVERVPSGHLAVTIAAEQGLTYTTQFVGTRSVAGALGPVGEVLAETSDNPAVYELDGSELYVRAKVISSRDHPNPYAAGDKECAWVQPVTSSAP